MVLCKFRPIAFLFLLMKMTPTPNMPRLFMGFSSVKLWVGGSQALNLVNTYFEVKLFHKSTAPITPVTD